VKWIVLAASLIGLVMVIAWFLDQLEAAEHIAIEQHRVSRDFADGFTKDTPDPTESKEETDRDISPELIVKI
jgi:hypothetical protein